MRPRSTADGGSTVAATAAAVSLPPLPTGPQLPPLEAAPFIAAAAAAVTQMPSGVLFPSLNGATSTSTSNVAPVTAADTLCRAREFFSRTAATNTPATGPSSTASTTTLARQFNAPSAWPAAARATLRQLLLLQRDWNVRTRISAGAASATGRGPLPPARALLFGADDYFWQSPLASAGGAVASPTSATATLPVPSSKRSAAASSGAEKAAGKSSSSSGTAGGALPSATTDPRACGSGASVAAFMSWVSASVPLVLPPHSQQPASPFDLQREVSLDEFFLAFVADVADLVCSATGVTPFPLAPPSLWLKLPKLLIDPVTHRTIKGGSGSTHYSADLSAAGGDGGARAPTCAAIALPSFGRNACASAAATVAHMLVEQQASGASVPSTPVGRGAPTSAGVTGGAFATAQAGTGNFPHVSGIVSVPAGGAMCGVARSVRTCAGASLAQASAAIEASSGTSGALPALVAGAAAVFAPATVGAATLITTGRTVVAAPAVVSNAGGAAGPGPVSLLPMESRSRDASRAQAPSSLMSFTAGAGSGRGSVALAGSAAVNATVSVSGSRRARSGAATSGTAAGVAGSASGTGGAATGQHASTSSSQLQSEPLLSGGFAAMTSAAAATAAAATLAAGAASAPAVGAATAPLDLPPYLRVAHPCPAPTAVGARAAPPTTLAAQAATVTPAAAWVESAHGAYSIKAASCAPGAISAAVAADAGSAAVAALTSTTAAAVTFPMPAMAPTSSGAAANMVSAFYEATASATAAVAVSCATLRCSAACGSLAAVLARRPLLHVLPCAVLLQVLAGLRPLLVQYDAFGANILGGSAGGGDGGGASGADVKLPPGIPPELRPLFGADFADSARDGAVGGDRWQWLWMRAAVLVDLLAYGSTSFSSVGIVSL